MRAEGRGRGRVHSRDELSGDTKVRSAGRWKEKKKKKKKVAQKHLTCIPFVAAESLRYQV